MSRTLPIRIAIVLALAIPAIGARAASALSASAVASRASGVAPLAVFFDGRGSSDTGTSSDSMFLDAAYSWDFGDTPCETRGDVWQYSGKSKCSDMGPVAGHVYETPGTYTATLTVRHGGATASRTVQITVSDPASVFSGSNTACVSTTSDFSGCPSGATHVTSSADFSQILSSYLRSGTRVLFHRGQSWSANGSYNYQLSGPCLVGAFASGAKPLIHLGSVRMFTFQTGSQGLTMMDLEIAGNNAQQGPTVVYTGSSGQTGNLLIFRVDVHNVSTAFQPSTKGGTPGTSSINNNLSIVDSTSQQRTAHSGNYDFFGGAERMLFMGNNFGNEQGAEHDVRVIYSNGAVISHNYLGPLPESNKSILKVHSEEDLPGSPCTQGLEIADNTINSGLVSTSTAFGPQNRTSPTECVNLVRIERNFFTMAGNATGTRSIWLAQGPDLVANNIFNLSATQPNVGPAGVTLWSNGNAPTVDNRMYNNTCYASPSTSTAPQCVQIQSGTNTIVRNTLLYSTLSGSLALSGTGSGTVQSNNLVVSTNPFSQSQLVLPGDYKLAPGSPAVDAGSNAVDTTGSDFSGIPGSRLSGSAVDIGAWELGSGTTTASGSPPSPPVLLP